jgi:cyclophilin family peptidyl-prolyl cis-trans isomerase
MGQRKREMERKAAQAKRLWLAVAAVVVAAVAVAAFVLTAPSPSGPPPAGQAQAYGIINTASGVIVFRFFEAEAPITSANFIGLVQGGYYNGLPWHRVVSDFVIQTGDKPSDPRPSIPLELNPALHNSYGTLGVARTSDPNSGSTQFYINTDDNLELDTTGGGYAVFGIVTRGMEVAERVPQGEIISSITFQRSTTPP